MSNFLKQSSGIPRGAAIAAGDLPTIVLTGNVTGSASGGSIPTTISAGVVTLANMANLTANSIIGNNTGSATTPLALTATQVTAMLNTFTTSLQGLAPSSGGGTTNFLRADGTWAAPSAGALTLTGDVTGSGTGSVATTLATINTNTGSFGSSTSIPSFTVNGKGLITAASGNAVVAPAGTLSGTTLNSTVVTSSLTSVGTIGTGTWNGTTIAVAHGGTGVTTSTGTGNVVLSTTPSFTGNPNFTSTSGTGFTFVTNSATALASGVYVGNNNTTGTNGDGNFPITIYKNSTTNNSTQNFVLFAVNAQSTENGSITANGANSAGFTTTSDSRLKTNITDLPSQLPNICALRPVEFDYLDGSGHQIGFIAQEIQTVYSDVVTTRQDGFLQLTGWSKTESRLVKAIQELYELNVALQARITALENK